MAYPDITLLSQLVVGQVDPADSEAANQLAAAVRQLKSFLCDYLAVSHDDTGALKQEALDNASQIALNIITGDKIAHNTIELVNMASDSVDTPQLVDDAVMTNKIADAQVTAAKLATGAVTGVKIGAGEVDTTQLADDAVTNAKVADNSITSDKLAGDGTTTKLGDKLSADSVALTTLNKVSAGEPCVAVIMESAANNCAAQIGGMLSATLDTTTTPATLKFAIGSTAGQSGALIRQSTTGVLTNATWNVRGGLTRVIGDDTVVKVAGGNTIQIIQDGTYLVIFAAMAYEAGDHQVVIEDDSTPAQRMATGCCAFADTGHQTMSFGFGIIDVDGYDSTTPLNLQLKHWASTLTGASGQGKAVLADNWTAAVLIVGV